MSHLIVIIPASTPEPDNAALPEGFISTRQAFHSQINGKTSVIEEVSQEKDIPSKHLEIRAAVEIATTSQGKPLPWQHGSNENTNGLLRQYFPKRTDLSGYSQAELDRVALRLNQSPRKTLGFETPASRLRASVATTH